MSQSLSIQGSIQIVKGNEMKVENLSQSLSIQGSIQIC